MAAIDLARRFNAAMEARDVAQLAALYAKNVIVWHSHDEIEQTKPEALAAAEAFLGGLAECRCEVTALHPTEVGFVQQHRLVGRRADGRPFRGSPLCIVVVAEGGLIRRLDEYIGLKPPKA